MTYMYCMGPKDFFYSTCKSAPYRKVGNFSVYDYMFPFSSGNDARDQAVTFT